MLNNGNGKAVEVASPTELSAITEGEINVQIATAKRFPRVMSEVREKIFELATLDKETAERCWYALPRDGKVIEGPSIRLAEIVASSYKNLRVGTREIGTDDKTVKCQAVCMDLENNVAIQTEVKRRIVDKKGRRYSEDMIITTTNAGCSIALRNAIFKVIPMVLFKSVLDRVKKVGMGDERTFAETRVATVEKLCSLGATRQQVCDIVGVRAQTDMTVEHVATLRGIVTAIEEGTTTVDECFGQPARSGKPVTLAPTVKPEPQVEPPAEPKGREVGGPPHQVSPPAEEDSREEPPSKDLPSPHANREMSAVEFAAAMNRVRTSLEKSGWTAAEMEMKLVAAGYCKDDLENPPESDRRKVVSILSAWMEPGA